MNFRRVSFLQVKYRMDGDVAKTICHVDEKAKDIEHAKKVSQQVSKVRSRGWVALGYSTACTASISVWVKSHSPPHRECELDVYTQQQAPQRTEVA